MIFTNVDPRYTGRVDDQQGSDTIARMERFREANTFNEVLKDKSI